MEIVGSGLPILIIVVVDPYEMAKLLFPVAMHLPLPPLESTVHVVKFVEYMVVALEKRTTQYPD